MGKLFKNEDLLSKYSYFFILKNFNKHNFLNSYKRRYYNTYNGKN